MNYTLENKGKISDNRYLTSFLEELPVNLKSPWGLWMSCKIVCTNKPI